MHLIYGEVHMYLYKTIANRKFCNNNKATKKLLHKAPDMQQLPLGKVM